MNVTSFFYGDRKKRYRLDEWNPKLYTDTARGEIRSKHKAFLKEFAM